MLSLMWLMVLRLMMVFRVMWVMKTDVEADVGDNVQNDVGDDVES